MVLDLTKENIYILWGENRNERLYFDDLEKLDNKELTMLVAHIDAAKQAYREEKALIHVQIQAEDFSIYTKAQLIAKLHGLDSIFSFVLGNDGIAIGYFTRSTSQSCIYLFVVNGIIHFECIWRNGFWQIK